MKTARKALILLVLAGAAQGCATASTATQRNAHSRYETLPSNEIAKLAVKETLGELHDVKQIDGAGRVVEGRAAFNSRKEREDFDARVNALLRERLKLRHDVPVRVELEKQCLKTLAWNGWMADELKRRGECSWADASVSIHAIWKKPRLQRVYVDSLLEAAQDEDFALYARARIETVSQRERQPYVFQLEPWEYVEGYRVTEPQ